MGSQQFCLRWDNHQTNMLNVFDQLLQSEDFVDVTLACEGLSIKAHKVVLSACSPYFQSLFKENPCKHPIVILKDMKYVELRSIVDFMYKGEINVSQDQLSALLKTAETLRVKGLAEVSSGAAAPPPPVHMRGLVDDENHRISDEGDGEELRWDIEETQHQQELRLNSGIMMEPVQDGRISSRRKRHRPARRTNSEESVVLDHDSLENGEGEVNPKITPKTELQDFVFEPPIEHLMETNSNYDVGKYWEMEFPPEKVIDDVTFPSDAMYDKMIRCLEMENGETDPDIQPTMLNKVRTKYHLDVRNGQKIVLDKLSMKPIAKQSEMQTILKLFHDDNNHSGRDVTRQKIRQVYAFCNVRAVKNYIKKCNVCQLRKKHLFTHFT